jgi:uncharacterized protein YciI
MKDHGSVVGARFLAAVAVASFAFGGSAPAQEAEPPGPPQAHFLVEYTTGPAWISDKPFPEQAHAADHSANLRRLRGEGTLVLGARHGDKGMVILRSGSEAAARAEVESDAAVASGVFVYTIEELRTFYGGCIEPPAAPPSPSGTAPG